MPILKHTVFKYTHSSQYRGLAIAHFWTHPTKSHCSPRNYVLKQILSECPKGRRPMLQVIIDLTTLEKSGKFKPFEPCYSVYNGKTVLHLLVLYLVVGRWRIPWSFRVCPVKNTPSPAQLGLKLIKGLPKALSKHFQVMILVDTAYVRVEFLHSIRKLKYHFKSRCPL